MSRILLLFPLLVCHAWLVPAQHVHAKTHNVLFIAIDDMNDWTTLFDRSNPIQTPNLLRLAARGTFFSRAYCNSPACNPSRASVLSGVRPSTSGVYDNRSNWNKAMPDVSILPQHFKDHGYRTYASGKIFHHQGTAFWRYEAFDEFLPFPSDQPDRPMPRGGNLNGIRLWTNPQGRRRPISPNFDWGAYPPDESTHIDNRTVDWAIDRIQHAPGPFFIAVGIFRPHMPFFAPERWYHQYPLQDLRMPEFSENDWDDIPPEGLQMLHPSSRPFISTFRAERARDPQILAKAVRGYQAASSFADHSVGRLLDALDACEKSDDTVIVLWSDHGFHLGEKDHWEKFVLYEKATRIPYIIVAPGFGKGQVSYRPVTLIDLYPTLVELCELPTPDHLEGESLTPLLRDPTAKKAPAVMTFGQDNHAVRNERYRYISYAGGDEELYDTEGDPHEWRNLAREPSSRQIMDSMARWLPQTNADPIEAARR